MGRNGSAAPLQHRRAHIEQLSQVEREQVVVPHQEALFSLALEAEHPLVLEAEGVEAFR